MPMLSAQHLVPRTSEVKASEGQIGEPGFGEGCEQGAKR